MQMRRGNWCRVSILSGQKIELAQIGTELALIPVIFFGNFKKMRIFKLYNLTEFKGVRFSLSTIFPFTIISLYRSRPPVSRII